MHSERMRVRRHVQRRRLRRREFLPLCGEARGPLGPGRLRAGAEPLHDA